MQIKEIKIYIILTAFFLISAGLLLLLFSKAEIHIAINKYNSFFLDLFFKNFTFFGSGMLLFILIVISLFVNKKISISLILASILILLSVKILKNHIFMERPITYFKYIFQTDYQFHYVKNVEIHNYKSFPSGHAATAFTLFLFLSTLINKNKILFQTLFFVCAFLVAYSRMYLMQHFLIDVFFGALIGILFSVFSIFAVNKLFSKMKENSIIQKKIKI